MADIIFSLAQHVDQISRLTQAGHLLQAKAYVTQLDLATQQTLDAWLAYTLNQPIQHTSQLPQVLYECLHGWQAYYKHQYLKAHEHFSAAIQQKNWRQLTPHVALGLCKVYTRTGHWHSAREWALYYLSQARQKLHHFDVAKGYGALAEIFLRANHAQQALACFQMAHHLMPVGHGQQARQLNFIASALLRNGEYSRAEDLLLESRQMSRQQLQRDQQDTDASLSFLHSTMRLYWLQVLYSGKCQYELEDDSIQNILNTIKTRMCTEVTMPLGMINLAYGASHLINGQVSTAQQVFKVARDTFGENMLMEYQWALRLLDPSTEVDGSAMLRAIENIFTLEVLHPPIFNSIVDTTWHKPKLHNQGFAPLVAKYDQATDIIDLWRLFFI